jgi:rhamnopyranosyl-N-acetylglucosaminyl-diphospho-decaprenol beta-1,3/1,4-galactofuranosyltransferase
MDKNTVCAVVVTYNRKELLIECLEALENQSLPLDAIYIIDNDSIDGTLELLYEKGYVYEIPSTKASKPYEKTLKKDEILIHYLRLPENTGGAGGFHEGVKNAYEKGYNWLWLMDDDAIPKDDALEKLSEYFRTENLSALANLKVDMDGNILSQHRGLFNFKDPSNIVIPITDKKLEQHETLEIDHASFVGILINKTAISKAGLPKKEFFIHFDDLEYCIRLRQEGKILLIKNSVIVHKEHRNNEFIEKRFLGKIHEFWPFEKLWLSYYGLRNYIWINKMYNEGSSWNFHKYFASNYLKQVIWILIAGDNKYKRIVFLTNVFYDALTDNFQNNKPKEILYN